MDDVQRALCERYPQVHPLLFHRSMEKAVSHGELFDILESLPEEYPIVWDDKQRKWVSTDLLQTHLLKSDYGKGQ